MRLLIEVARVKDAESERPIGWWGIRVGESAGGSKKINEDFLKDPSMK